MKRLVIFAFLVCTAVGFCQDKAEVFFAFDRYDLATSEQLKLDSWIASNPNVEVSAIYGYCDRIGRFNYNDSLSLKRARTVSDYLKANRVSFSHDFLIDGFGEKFQRSLILAQNRKVAIFYKTTKPSQTAATELKKKLENAKVGEKIKLPGLNFYNMSDVVVPGSRAVLDELLGIMRGNPNLKVEIQGHICCQTDKEKDYSYVSTQRAKAVRDFLVKNGVDAARLSYKGFGVSRPLHPIPEKTEKEQDENRRVEVEILGN